MEFTGAGSDKFEEITRNLHVRGRLRQAPQHFAIVLDRDQDLPQIDYTDSSLAGGIGGGRAQITGLESIQEAKDIAIVLQTGAAGEVRERSTAPTSRRRWGRTRWRRRRPPPSPASSS